MIQQLIPNQLPLSHNNEVETTQTQFYEKNIELVQFIDKKKSKQIGQFEQVKNHPVLTKQLEIQQSQFFILGQTPQKMNSQSDMPIISQKKTDQKPSIKAQNKITNETSLKQNQLYSRIKENSLISSIVTQTFQPPQQQQKQINVNTKTSLSFLQSVTKKEQEMVKDQYLNGQQIQNSTSMKNLSKQQKIQTIKLRIQAAQKQRMAGNISLALDILSEVKKTSSTIIDEDDIHGTVQGIKLFNKGLQLKYITKLAKIYYYIQDYQESANIYKKLIKKITKQPALYQGAGDSLRHLNRNQSAVSAYSKGIKIIQQMGQKQQKLKSSLLNSRGIVYLNTNKFQLAISDFLQAARLQPQNPIYFCHLGCAYQLKGQKQAGTNYFVIAKYLVQNSIQHPQLSNQNTKYIHHKITSFLSKLQQVNSIKTSDNIISKRIQKFSQFFIGLEADSSQDELQNQVLDIQTTNEFIQFISKEGNQKLYQFYDGGLFTLCQSYSTSRVVLSSILEIHTHSIPSQIFKQLLHFVPVVGAALVPLYQNIHYYEKKCHIQRAANNICKMATLQSQFEAIAQDALCKFMKQNIKQIKNFDPNRNALKSWASRFHKFSQLCKQKYQSFYAKLYGQRNQTQMQKYGHKIICDLIEKYLSNGQIYNKQPSISIKKQEKVQRIYKKLQQIWNEDYLKDQMGLKTKKSKQNKAIKNQQNTESFLIETLLCNSPRKKYIKFQENQLNFDGLKIPYSQIQKISVFKEQNQKVLLSIFLQNKKYSFKMKNTTQGQIQRLGPLEILRRISKQKTKKDKSESSSQSQEQSQNLLTNKQEQKKNKILYQGPVFKKSQTLGRWGQRFVCISQQKIQSYKNGELSFIIQSQKVKCLNTQFKRYRDKIVFRIQYDRNTQFGFDLQQSHNGQKIIDAFYKFTIKPARIAQGTNLK